MLSAKSAREIYEKYPKQFRKNSINCNTGWLKIIDEMCATIQIYVDFETLPSCVSNLSFLSVLPVYKIKTSNWKHIITDTDKYFELVSIWIVLDMVSSAWRLTLVDLLR